MSITIVQHSTPYKMVECDDGDMCAEADLDNSDSCTHEYNGEEPPVEWALGVLENCMHASSSIFWTGVWYSEEADTDIMTESWTEESYHLKGFSLEQEGLVFDTMEKRGKIS